MTKIHYLVCNCGKCFLDFTEGMALCPFCYVAYTKNEKGEYVAKDGRKAQLTRIYDCIKMQVLYDRDSNATPAKSEETA